jgi:transposase
MTYTKDDRAKALAFVDASLIYGNSLRKSILYSIQRMNDALVSDIGRDTIYCWYNERLASGTIAPKRMRRCFHPLFTPAITEFARTKLEESCDLQIHELALLIYVEFAIIISDDVVLKFVHDVGYTHKVLEIIPGGRIAADRLEFRRVLDSFSPEQLVFGDETHSTEIDVEWVGHYRDIVVS